MNHFNFSFLSRFICCHPSQFETGEILCSSLIGKYITHRQHGNPCTQTGVDFAPNYFQRPGNSAPYYYGDIAYQQQQNNPHWSNFEAPKYSALMDGLRIQLKNQGRQNAQCLRSPNVHRSDEFKVSLRGWLYRLEGAALKQWKRRWCVLADYCIFYYKDMAEEKMLGSLILPSYKISPCFSRDGISRKFAFKAEHNNMKTYYFAADSKEIQQQWMNALSMASIMQLNAIFPSSTANCSKNSNSLNTGTTITYSSPHANRLNGTRSDQNQSSNRNKELLEDESGFVAYQTKRIEENNSAIMYGLDYYNSNMASGSLNLYNSVGLPSIYPNSTNEYISAPPKPQRQYYDMMMAYDIPSPSLQEYKIAAPDLINHNSSSYYIEEHERYFEDSNFVTSYNDYLPVNKLNDYRSNYGQRLPPRPHSADFLERNLDYDVDEECQNAFETADNANYMSVEMNLPPKIMPTRPKSSIERYDSFYESRLSNKPIGLDTKGEFYGHSAQIQEIDSNLQNIYNAQTRYQTELGKYSSSNFLYNYSITEKQNDELGNETISRMQPSFAYAQSEIVGNGSTPTRPPLPQEYALKFVSQRMNGQQAKQIKSKLALSKSDSTGKETSYTSDDENRLALKIRTKQNNQSLISTESTSENSHNESNDLVEISKEEYYKASQMFFQRHKQSQIAPLNSSYASSESKTTSQSSINQNVSSATAERTDWNEIGLPIPDSKYFPGQNSLPYIKETSNSFPKQSLSIQENLNHSDYPNSDLSFDGQNKNIRTEILDCSSITSDEQEVKFKLGVKVRTYKKPKPQSCTRLLENGKQKQKNGGHNLVESLDVNPAYETFGKNGVHSNENLKLHHLAENEEEGKQNTKEDNTAEESSTRSNTNSAPYYYSDLLTEEQKIALQKKLGNFSLPPPLLSRCSAVNNARYLGMTTLASKANKDKVENPVKQVVNNDASITDANHNEQSNQSKANNERQSSQINSDSVNASKESDDIKESTKKDIFLKKVSSDNESRCNSNESDCQQHIYENYDQPKVSTDSKEGRFDTGGNNVCAESRNTKVSDTKNRINVYSGNSGESKVPAFGQDFDSQVAQSDHNTSDSIDSVREMSNVKKIKKKRIKRKSKEDINNVSDSEIQLKKEKHRKGRSFKTSKRLCVSAADYIGKSHEDLILMLIQLRRKQSELSKSCDKLRIQMESEEKMMEIEPHRREEYIYRFNQLRQQLVDVEKEYEFQIPIIETIDNMIKTKSKSKQNKLNKRAVSTSVLDQVTLDHANQLSLKTSANANVDIVRKKVNKDSSIAVSTPETPNENIENLKKQQKVLEGELDRVRGMLTHSTKKLEEKAVENAQMEQEMLTARNKLKQVLETEQEAMEITRSSKLEAELVHINKVIDDLHSRRQELNAAIDNLKKSEAKYSKSYRYTNLGENTSFKSLVEQSKITPNEFDIGSMNIEDIFRCRSSLIDPLYENLVTAQKYSESKENIAGGSKILFDKMNNNVNENNSENDEFFTLNINLDKGKHHKLYSSSDQSESEINNNEFQQNGNSMCEFDPTKDLLMTYGDSIVDQNIKQIYNYPYPTAQKVNEIKTVREVKRESERRKFNQQQQIKLANFYRTDPSYYDSYYYTSNHFYQDNESANTSSPSMENLSPNIAKFDEMLKAYKQSSLTNQVKSSFELTEDLNRNNFNTPDIVQSTIKFNDDIYDKET